MLLPEDFGQLQQTLEEAGVSGQQLRVSLLRQCSDLIQHLTHDLGVPTVLDTTNESAQEPSHADPEEETSVAPLPLSSPRFPEYGDEADLHQVRMEALDVFDHRRLDEETYAVLWMDVLRVWGAPFLLCIGSTLEGDRRMLGFEQASAQNIARVKHLFASFLHRGLSLDDGLLCITPVTVPLDQVLMDLGGEHIRLQHCHLHKRERIVSVLTEEQQTQMRGQINRAFSLPDAKQAREALLQIHDRLLRWNRSASQRLFKDLDLCLTLHQTGLYEQLSRSLRTTSCVTHTAQYVNQHPPLACSPVASCTTCTVAPGTGITDVSTRSCFVFFRHANVSVSFSMMKYPRR